MKKTLKPLVVIAIAIALAAGAALVLSRQDAGPSKTEAATASLQTSAPAPVAGQDPNYLPKSLPGGQGGIVRGDATAPVTLVEFGDYQCPTCGAFHPIVKELMRREGSKLKLEFHHYPLIQLHANAFAA